MLRKAPLRLLLTCYCWVLLSGQPVSSQPVSVTDSIVASQTRLLDLGKRVLTIQKDLSQLHNAMPAHDSERNHISWPLRVSCGGINMSVSHALDVLWLFESMSSTKDRERVRKDVQARLNSLIRMLEIEIELANDAIAYTTKPGIASTATELRNVTRQIIEVLKAVRL